MTTTSRRRLVPTLALVTAATATATLLFAPASPAATAKAGGACTKAGATSGAFVCTRKAGRLVWAKAAAGKTATTARATGSGAATTVASGAVPVGIEGAWKATAQSVVGYRVKEVLAGQDAEAVGRTSAVTGTLVIAGTKATSAEVTVDVRTLRSDESRRDGQVQGRILETSRWPTAKLKLVEPVDFGKVPADKEVVAAKAKIELTVRDTTKTVEVDLQARRNGGTVEVNGAIPIKFSEWNIPNPTFGLAKVGDNGTIEFLVVFGR